MNNRPIGLMEVKQALRDTRFRNSLPESFKDDIQKYLNNPGCACNLPIYHKIIKEAKKELQAYYPNRNVADVDAEVEKLAKNNWSVINCHVDELESKLKRLPPGRKQLAVTRFEDQVTVVVNELDLIF
jgi:hypothetical protein